jgi:hypothetical protein
MSVHSEFGTLALGRHDHKVKKETTLMISTEHLDAYLEAMGRRDVEGTKAHLADDVVIRSPIAPSPFQGKEQVTGVLKALLSTVDAFEPKLLLRDRESNWLPASGRSRFTFAPTWRGAHARWLVETAACHATTIGQLTTACATWFRDANEDDISNVGCWPFASSLAGKPWPCPAMDRITR